MLILSLFRLKTFKNPVVDPTVVNTVSKMMVSDENSSLYEGSVLIISSLLQDDKISETKKRKARTFIVIASFWMIIYENLSKDNDS